MQLPTLPAPHCGSLPAEHVLLLLQILGLEARSRVPAEFMVQYPDSANPPTLFLVLSDMAKRAAAASQAGNALSPEQTAEADFLRAGAPATRQPFETVSCLSEAAGRGSAAASRWACSQAACQVLGLLIVAAGSADFLQARSACHLCSSRLWQSTAARQLSRGSWVHLVAG